MKRDKQTNTLIYNKRLNLNDSLHDKQVWGGGEINHRIDLTSI